MEISELNKLLGNIDLYLLDQLLKGRFTKEMMILDAGCGEGRNTHYFIQKGYRIVGVDGNSSAISMARISGRTLDPNFDPLRFQVAELEDIPFHSEAFDAVLSSAVLHFAKNKIHFLELFQEHMRVLKPGGLFWLRMCTDAGGAFVFKDQPSDLMQNLPDGTIRFVLTEPLLKEIMNNHNLSLLEPAKSVLVHHKRAMGVFVFQKKAGKK
ncbi:class I SAM-dependent methyltransferase [Cyclobacterium marinum]|uniref:Methyltransferase type 11 n=1 Tax=Cyclobacterium marinum (strain ATCC 25205 / DSM 745 / LMG 13164 / NCIMB 1802) TaxID=880070 RepID=G0IZL5_CYCMS|nr:class I SAM-dependent methyltransferase [Cyclobacterium marinum]AEL25056.1 Methyltransferase type 11 [Cyclobacterium marinum DSM 745]